LCGKGFNDSDKRIFERSLIMENKIDKWLEKRGEDIKDEWIIRTQERIKRCESPIERLFFLECLYQTEFWSDYENIFIMPQYQVDNFRVDFFFYIDLDNKHFPNNKESNLIVEIDSYLWHGSNPEQFAKEKERERCLQKEGYQILRYSGKEIYRNVQKCVEEVLDHLLNIETKILEKEFKETKNNNKG
jgi:very-short-patch-repair endonuclease